MHTPIYSGSILRLPEVKARTGLSRSTIYALIKKERFPSHISLAGTSCVGWLESEINTWITDRIAASRTPS